MKISVIIISFNQGQFLEETIISVVNQDYDNKEIILIDGGSGDSSLQVIEKYSSHFEYWVSEPDKGQSDALVKGFSKASGELISWINSDDISLGADYYSGHAVIERPGEHKVTDLGKVEPEIIESENEVNLITNQKWGSYTFSQNIILKNDKITFEKRIKSDAIEKAVIRPFSFTFNPEVWDRESLYIATHNGGSALEKFYLKGQNISHGDIYSSLISARHGFGNTEGKIIIGDKEKAIVFECDMSVSALIPSIIYKEMDGTYYFRLQYSAMEMDETVKPNMLELFSILEVCVQKGK